MRAAQDSVLFSILADTNVSQCSVRRSLMATPTRIESTFDVVLFFCAWVLVGRWKGEEENKTLDFRPATTNPLFNRFFPANIQRGGDQ